MLQLQKHISNRCLVYAVNGPISHVSFPLSKDNFQSKKSTHFHIVFSLTEAAPTFLMVCFLSRVIIYSSWLWNIGCNLKEGMQELWIFWSAKMRVLHNMWQLPRLANMLTAGNSFLNFVMKWISHVCEQSHYKPSTNQRT